MYHNIKGLKDTYLLELDSVNFTNHFEEKKLHQIKSSQSFEPREPFTSNVPLRWITPKIKT